MAEILSLNIQSEIGELEGVILHTPGAEVENMTPGTAQRALYSDILNLFSGLDIIFFRLHCLWINRTTRKTHCIGKILRICVTF